jgi:hypothetical protein
MHSDLLQELLLKLEHRRRALDEVSPEIDPETPKFLTNRQKDIVESIHGGINTNHMGPQHHSNPATQSVRIPTP